MGFWNLKDCECTEVIRSDQKPIEARVIRSEGLGALQLLLQLNGTARAMLLLAIREERLASASSGRCLRPEGLQLH